MRGDQPAVVARRPVSFAFTPHARGSTPLKLQSLLTKKIYPACAGINPGERQVHRKHQHLPRRRGDQPNSICLRLAEHRFTPHLGQIVLICLHLPRVCGDQPGYTFVLDYWCEFPPRARGSTLVIALSADVVYIYPACAGINHDALTAETAGMSKVAQKFHW